MAKPVVVTLKPITAAVMLVLAGPVVAATIPVNGTSCTLSSAIKAANTDTAVGGCVAGRGADTLNLTAATYRLGVADSDKSSGWNGLPLVTSVVTVNGDPDGDARGVVIQRSRARGTPRFLVMAVAGGKLTLKYVTVRNGSPHLTYNGYYSISEPGGGIAVFGGSLTLDHSTITGNSAYNPGGGIYAPVPSKVTLRDSVVSNNVATSTFRNDDFPGGGIFGDVTLVRSVVSENDGGGIYGKATLIDSIVRDNTSHSRVGGIESPSGTIRLRRSTVSGNVSYYFAGGIQGSFAIQNSTVSGNTNMYAVAAGGISGSGTIVHSTIAGNDGTGLTASGRVTLTNTIIARNGDRYGASPDCAGTPVFAGVNLIGDGSCGGPGGHPKLGPLLNNGGLVPTHALLAGSPAINTAGGAACRAEDQRGAKRPQGVGCDIGAFERVRLINASVQPVVAFFNGAVAAGTLLGTGAAADKTFRVQAIRHALLLAGEFKRAGSTLTSCDELKRTLDRVDTDGAVPDEGDYVTGSAVPQLVTTINTARTELGCIGGSGGARSPKV